MRAKPRSLAWAFACGLTCLLLSSPARAQVEFDDDFADNPVDNGWFLQGTAVWVPQDAFECDDLTVNAPDPLDPCTLHPEDSDYVLLTTGQNNQNGSVFFEGETFLVENLDIQVEFELRDGTATPADGMGIVLIGSDVVPPPGVGGGGMGLAGLGPFPTLAAELDNWQNGTEPSANHVDLHYSPDGFADFAAVNNLASTSEGYNGDIEQSAAGTFNNGEIHPASPNRWLARLAIQSEPAADAATPRTVSVAMFLENLDLGINLGQVFNVQIDDFVPFEAFLGVTAATGGADQNSLVHFVSVDDDPPCLIPPATVSRAITGDRVPEDFCGGNFLPGDNLGVELTIDSVRTADDNCDAPASLTIVDQLPDGWDASGISNGGAFNAATGQVTWTLNGNLEGTTVSYTLETGNEDGALGGSVANGADDEDASSVPSALLKVGDDPANCVADEFEFIFDEDPFLGGGGWIINGATRWIEPPGDAILCIDQASANAHEDPVTFEPCSVYDEAEVDPDEFGGYVLVTPGANGQGGNAFREESALYSSFQLEIVVELRDGSIGRPADGMTVVLIGSDDPPALGGGGGGMGATNLGPFPTMVFEFDDWSCNAGDNNDENHVGFVWEPNGVTGELVMDEFVPIDQATTPLHNRQPHPAEPNRYKMTVLVVGGQVACSLEALDLGIDLGTLYTHQIENFQPFRGFLGVTGSTGDANQNHILHSAKLTILEDVCIVPAGQALRSFSGLKEDDGQGLGGQFNDGDELGVTLTIDSLREPEDGDDPCQAPANLRVTDTPPEGWTIDEASISDGGTLADGTVTWQLSGGDVAVGTELSYSVTATGADERRVFNFSGGMLETEAGGGALAGAQTGVHGGITSLQSDYAYDANCGGILAWNTLGPFVQSIDVVGEFDGVGVVDPNPGNNPGLENLALDYMTDGDEDEISFEWRPGAEIETDFNGDAASQGIYTYDVDGDGTEDINPDGIPTVLRVIDADSFINLNDDHYINDPNGVMSYAQCYVRNNSEDDVEAFFGVSSDDSVQVLLNGEEVWANSVPRGGADACNPQDISPTPVILEPGVNSLIVKTFEGGGGFNFAFVFQNDFGRPLAITQPGLLSIELSQGGGPPVGTQFTRGDADASGAINITDGIFILNFLFLGGPDPTCTAAGDADASGVINITDGIFVLNFLFLGGPNPPAPHPDCGAIEGADCGAFAGCP